MANRTTAERIVFLSGVRDQIENRLSDMMLKPKPSYNVDGQTFEFNDYQKMLMDALERLDAFINVLETAGGSGKLVMTQVFTGNA